MANPEDGTGKHYHNTTRPHEVLQLVSFPDIVIIPYHPIILRRSAGFRPDLLQESSAKRSVQVPVIFAGPMLALKEAVLREIYTYGRTLLPEMSGRESCHPFAILDGCEVCRYVDKILNEVDSLASCTAMLRTATSTEIIEVLREILNRLSEPLGFDLEPFKHIVEKLDMSGETPQSRQDWLTCDLVEFYDQYKEAVTFYKQRTEWQVDINMNVVNFFFVHSVLLFRDIIEKHFRWSKAPFCDKLFFHKALVDDGIGEELSSLLNKYCEVLSPKLFALDESDFEYEPFFANSKQAHHIAVILKRKIMRYFIILNDIRIFNKDILSDTILGPDVKSGNPEFSQYHR